MTTDTIALLVAVLATYLLIYVVTNMRSAHAPAFSRWEEVKAVAQGT